MEVITRRSAGGPTAKTEKAAVVAEAPAPGVTVSEVSPRPGIAESLIHSWRLAQRKAVSIANELVQQFIPYGGVTDAAAADPVMALTPVPITPAPAPAKPSSPAKATDAPVARTRGRGPAAST
ncbi:IS66 family insertion sequence element accessory protein TnpB [Sphingomonas mollis]|uniref:IS66 family insertion sequence element accessory protein TnpB n=1 Tax=Sphingomonas mollis TaxID=2795726 RepID=UPI001E46FA68|nr:IS66 family insertion sequence element accessory protein TnpB [Sphingomonas sp. BT553]